MLSFLGLDSGDGAMDIKEFHVGLEKLDIQVRPSDRREVAWYNRVVS